MNRSKLVLSLVLLFSVVIVFAQSGAPPATPIDGGLSALLAAGGIYGVKKAMSNRKSEN